jgi:hypothetical protein
MECLTKNNLEIEVTPQMIQLRTDPRQTAGISFSNENLENGKEDDTLNATHF